MQPRHHHRLVSPQQQKQKSVLDCPSFDYTPAGRVRGRHASIECGYNNLSQQGPNGIYGGLGPKVATNTADIPFIKPTMVEPDTFVIDAAEAARWIGGALWTTSGFYGLGLHHNGRANFLCAGGNVEFKHQVYFKANDKSNPPEPRLTRAKD